MQSLLTDLMFFATEGAAKSEMESLTWIDWSVVGLYVLVIAAICVFTSLNQNSTKDFFLGGRNVGWFAIGASLFAANIGSEHIVGLAGSGANDGMAQAHWEFHGWLMLMLAWIFVPFYYQSGVYTIPEFLERRFSAKARWILSLISLSAYVFTKVSVTVFAGALVFETLLPDTFGSAENAFWVGAFATVIFTGIYTTFGGLKAVLYTDALQSIILLLGSIFITWFGLKALAPFAHDGQTWWGVMQETIKQANQEQEFSRALWRPLSDPKFPWLGVMIASITIGVWYWCTDQYIVQRTLSARNLTQARRGAIYGAFLKIWPVMIFLVPGLIGYALYRHGALPLPEKIVDGVVVGVQGDKVFPIMVANLLPEGLRGLVVAGMLAALTSSLGSLFNSSATLFTVDIYQKLRPGQSQKHYLTVGRIATVVVVGLGLLWIPVMKLVSSGGLYEYLQGVQGYIAPPIAAVFLLGLFNKRINSYGAVTGLLAGFILGMLKLTTQTFFGTGAGKINVPVLAQIGDFNPFYTSGILLVISLVVIIVVSLMTPPPRQDQLTGLTYSCLDRKAIRESWNWVDVVTTVCVLGLIIGMYLYFSFWLS